MTGFGDVRDFIAQAPHVTHGHATQGKSAKEGPPYNLYQPRADVLRKLMGAPADGKHFVDRRLDNTGPPISIFEFGALNGYCLMALGVTAAQHGWVPRIGWCDNESTEPDSNERCRENLESLGLEASFVCTDRREALGFGTANLVCVDGDHTLEATLDDIAYGMLLKPYAILVDDVIPTHGGVVEACLQVRPLFFDAFRIPTVNGLVVLDNIVGLRDWMTKKGWVVQEIEEGLGA